MPAGICVGGGVAIGIGIGVIAGGAPGIGLQRVAAQEASRARRVVPRAEIGQVAAGVELLTRPAKAVGRAGARSQRAPGIPLTGSKGGAGAAYSELHLIERFADNGEAQVS